ncbi:hypothetical protein HZP84_12165 [Elizabethkingia anophelis]|uniref:hypothetical protein n=1 Tax=Elizabethkingia anophelis TaxID=1117645 RepID=UPI0015E07C71|nr:hypothetical protein [Elizabethkingia anophelis]MCT3692626.1 hypothetical protein [Elizabethkingia anophelis]MCT3728503.1 hypothetical protein [Elizabethkingia anophelis]MCT3760548.1 hypothetical protein [Elizabethkingia anophelis]MCT3824092.1 hypothetical protein [Elizabethkingia anophelis]MCT3932337.1 hypothetical protein [Elizabethkingia anophelis]
MKKDNQKKSQKKLSLKKFKVIKVSGLKTIMGGNEQDSRGNETIDKHQGTSII